MTVTPRSSGTARLQDVAEPEVGLESVVVETLAVGVCGTDVEIASAELRVATARKGATDRGPMTDSVDRPVRDDGAVAGAHPMRVMRAGELRRTVVGSSSGSPRSRTINDAGDGTMRATAGPLASISAQTSLGPRAIRDGAPTPDTAKRQYEHLDFMLGADAFPSRFDGSSLHAIGWGSGASASRTARSSSRAHGNARLRVCGRDSP